MHLEQVLALTVRGHEVRHLMTGAQVTPHPLHPALRVVRGRPVYDLVDGRPHLRVENRVLPAGPTVVRNQRTKAPGRPPRASM